MYPLCPCWMQLKESANQYLLVKQKSEEKDLTITQMTSEVTALKQKATWADSRIKETEELNRNLQARVDQLEVALKVTNKTGTCIRISCVN